MKDEASFTFILILPRRCRCRAFVSLLWNDTTPFANPIFEIDLRVQILATR